MTSLLLFSKRTPADISFAELASGERFKLKGIEHQAAPYGHKFLKNVSVKVKNPKSGQDTMIVYRKSINQRPNGVITGRVYLKHLQNLRILIIR